MELWSYDAGTELAPTHVKANFTQETSRASSSQTITSIALAVRGTPAALD
jgi:hypothetical protein